eukprot:g63932.t1
MIAFELHHRYGDPPRLSFLTMDPGTVSTKMLAAGWGMGGIPVEHATRSFELLTAPEYSTRSGICVGTYPDHEVTDPAARAELWEELVRLTGAVWPSPTRTPISFERRCSSARHQADGAR